MRKPSLLILVLLLFSYAVKSQSRIGIKAGFNLANQMKNISIPQQPSVDVHTEPLAGYQFGAFYKLKVSRRFLLSAEPAFSVIGARMTLLAPDGKTYNTKEKLGYIDLPLTVQYALNKFYFGGGPGVGFKTFSKLVGFEDRTYDISYYKSVDATGNILAGYSVGKKIDLNFRYSHGFVNIVKDPGYATTKNRFFNLSVLYYLK